jgi:hypothetical protein
MPASTTVFVAASEVVDAGPSPGMTWMQRRWVDPSATWYYCDSSRTSPHLSVAGYIENTLA